ncbi:TIGR02301 family protein [Leptospira interrogans]
MVRSGPGAGSRNRKCAIIGAAALGLLVAYPSVAQEARGYDDKLLRLSEILGAVHYLRELCGADEGQLWRDRMRDLIDAEGSSALRRARLTRSFNKGYQGYSRTYRTCTSSAQTAINRFLGEATQLADGLIRDVP